MWVCTCVGVHGAGLEGCAFCCGNLFYRFFKSSVCLLLSVSMLLMLLCYSFHIIFN